jgi:prolyl-tRNA synthetase
VPIRLEVGPKDLEKQQALAVLRHDGQKQPIPLDELDVVVASLLEKIHHAMYKK